MSKTISLFSAKIFQLCIYLACFDFQIALHSSCRSAALDQSKRCSQFVGSPRAHSARLDESDTVVMEFSPALLKDGNEVLRSSASALDLGVDQSIGMRSKELVSSPFPREDTQAFEGSSDQVVDLGRCPRGQKSCDDV